jgi:hypothetical protein
LIRAIVLDCCAAQLLQVLDAAGVTCITTAIHGLTFNKSRFNPALTP